MANWENIPTQEEIDNSFGFIYRITHLPSGIKYIGKKQLHSKTRKPPLKGKKRKRLVIKESDWREYFSSSEEIQRLLAKDGPDAFKREILCLTSCAWENMWLEHKYQVDENVLFRDDYINGIIHIRLGRPPKALVEKYKFAHDPITYNENDVNEFKSCKDDILYFAEKYIRINDKLIKLYPKQKEILSSWRDNRYNITNSSRQSGVSTLYAIFLLHTCIFHRDITNVILSSSQHGSDHMRELIINLHNNLPNLLKDEINRHDKENLIFMNGSRIKFSSFNSYGLRGFGINNLIMDNIDYIQEELFDEVFKYIRPMMASSKSSKIIIGGTPKNPDSKLLGLSKDKGWNITYINYKDIPPQNTPEFEKLIRSMAGDEFFNTEFALEYAS